MLHEDGQKSPLVTSTRQEISGKTKWRENMNQMLSELEKEAFGM